MQLEAMQGWGRSTVFGHGGLRLSGKRRRGYAELGFQRPGPTGGVSGAFCDCQQASGTLGPLSELTACTALTVGSTRWEVVSVQPSHLYRPR